MNFKNFKTKTTSDSFKPTFTCTYIIPNKTKFCFKDNIENNL